jgi:uncharacterized protein YndB with AHSA1/START domain
MEKLRFSAMINAPKERVWQALWNDANYRKWTTAFAEGSHARTENWKEGSKVLFLDGKGSGMVSRVAANKPNEFMSFEHLGVVKDGSEDTSSDEVKAWAGAKENYTLTEKDGKTKLDVEMDSNDEFKGYFEKTWPVAMEAIKEIAEAKLKTITVETTLEAPVEKAWESFTAPEHITKWCAASDDWHAPRAENDLREGGSFTTRMEAKDGSFGFDFGGVYSKVKPHDRIEYLMGDGRQVSVSFEKAGDQTRVIETFEMENTHSEEMQRGGWQAILDNYKKYTENLN